MLFKRTEKKLDRNYTRLISSCIEQVLEATPHKTAAVWPLSALSRKLSKLDEPDMQDTAGKVSDVILWIHSHGRAKVGRPAKTYPQ